MVKTYQATHSNRHIKNSWRHITSDTYTDMSYDHEDRHIHHAMVKKNPIT